MILLFPGEWHSYYPDKETGWDEYWVGFRGIHIDKRVEKRFFIKEEPLHKIGLSATIVGLYEDILKFALQEKSGYQQMISSIVLHILGTVYYKKKNGAFTNTYVVDKINEARILMKGGKPPVAGRNSQPVRTRLFLVPPYVQRIYRSLPCSIPATTETPPCQRTSYRKQSEHIRDRLQPEI